VHLIADGPQNRLHKGVNLYLESCKWVQPFPRARVRLAPQSDDTARGHAGQRKRYAEHLSVHISAESLESHVEWTKPFRYDFRSAARSVNPELRTTHQDDRHDRIR
jgi:hypothetical protein